jgi:hypothetical protein
MDWRGGGSTISDEAWGAVDENGASDVPESKVLIAWTYYSANPLIPPHVRIMQDTGGFTGLYQCLVQNTTSFLDFSPPWDFSRPSFQLEMVGFPRTQGGVNDKTEISLNFVHNSLLRQCLQASAVSIQRLKLSVEFSIELGVWSRLWMSDCHYSLPEAIFTANALSVF